jgi:hypothetical protein
MNNHSRAMRIADRLAHVFSTAPAGGGIARRCCERPGCQQDGEYRAPRSRSQMTQYRWFCLQHVREYNAAWNYYAGMSDDEVEADIRRDTVWQRPTWPFAATVRSSTWRAAGAADRFGFFGDGTQSPRREATAEEKALRVLELRPPVSVAAVKVRYKELVKRHHPDANGGDKAAEERFKKINEAYRTVMGSLTP